jgi:two-component system, chemotaxis family, chemotaxis protein CheY
MKTLIVEDDFTSRLIMQEFLKSYGPSHVAVNGTEAVEAVRISIEAKAPYDLICLDIMMPQMNGQEALRRIRELEKENEIIYMRGAKIIMTTALNDMSNLSQAYEGLCDGYIAKPIRREVLMETLRKLKLIS